MSNSRRIVSALVVCALPLIACTSAAVADQFEVEFRGSVEFCQVQSGPIHDGQPGDAVVVRFRVDSTNFVDSPNYPVRGYVIDPGSFTMTFDGTPVGLADTGAPVYFVMRNNDPAVDGFFVSDAVDWPIGTSLNLAGHFGPFGVQCSVGYEGWVLSSLDIADAVGTYEYNGLTSFYYGVTDGPFDATGNIFEKLTISAVAAPCVGDFDGNGTVDGADLGVLLGNWGGTGGADLNGDGTVDGADLGVLLGNWGGCN